MSTSSSSSSSSLFRICVFCGSSSGAQPGYLALARALGGALARRRIGLVYGGAHVGLMGALADAVRAAGGETIGVIPQRLVDKEIAHTGLDSLHIVESMHERKALMAKLADAFVALPGGFGTLDELFEILTWAQLRLHDKPVGLLNYAGFYDPMLVFLRRAYEEGFIAEPHLRLLLCEDDIDPLLDALDERRQRPSPPVLADKWERRPPAEDSTGRDPT